MSTTPIRIPAGPVTLEGFLGLPEGERGLVLFAHGSGSGRYSPRNSQVATGLREGGIGTVLLDLLTEEEAADRGKVFDIELLARRLLAATDWAAADPRTADLRVGYFGASTGAAAALVAAAERGERIGAVVSRGGRPDLAGDALGRVTAPTLLIVGGADVPVIPLNESAFAALRCEKELTIVPGAGHLFEEPGTLEEVTKAARAWFRRYLGEATQAGSEG